MSLPKEYDEHGNPMRPSLGQMAEHLFEDEGLPFLTFRNSGLVFFQPDMEFIRWLKEYAGQRIILEIGCGTGHVLHMLRAAGHSLLCGVEPQWDYMAQAETDIRNRDSILQVLPWDVERAADFIRTVSGAKAGHVQGCLLLFCRPCHSDFVEEAIDCAAPGTEVMYITKPENLERYCDLGRYEHLAKSIEYRGTCKDGEVVQVFTKP